MTIQAGQELGPYRIEGLLGQGAMGQVYRAQDPRLGRAVAIKFLTPDFASDAERLRRFELEARAIAQLNHPNIVQIFDTGLWEGVPYLVMELVEGQTLRNWMGPGASSARKGAAMAMQIAQGLAAAHDAGIVHRDLKPENVLIGLDGRPRILDFGLAKLFHRPGAGSTLATAALAGGTEQGRVVGTVGYMAPEQLLDGRLDGRTDLFALGVILWEILTGERPFQGASFVDIMHAILRQEPPDLPLALKVPPALDRILRRCLEKEPGHRFQNAQDLAFALQHLDSGSQDAGLPALPPLPARRRSWLVWAALLFGLMGAGVAGLFAGRRLFRAPEYRLEALLPYPMAVTSAKFMPDGKSFVFSVARPDGGEDLYLQNPGDPAPRSLMVKDAEVLAVSPTGEIALRWHPGNTWVLGVLGAPGLAPRVLGERDPLCACWDGEGKELIVDYKSFEGQRTQAIVYRGKAIYRLPWGFGFGGMILATGGSAICLVESNGAQVFFVTVGLDGQVRSKVPTPSIDSNGLVRADGRVVLLDGDGNALLEVREPAMVPRKYLPLMGSAVLYDGQGEGTLLLAGHAGSLWGQGGISRLWWQRPGASEARPEGADESGGRPILAQGGTLLGLTQYGHDTRSWLRRVDSDGYVPMGEGVLLALTEQGDWGIVLDSKAGGSVLSLLPTGPGRRKDVPGRWVRANAWFFAEGRQALIRGLAMGAEDLKERSYVLDTTTGQVRALAFDAMGPISKDGMGFAPPDDAHGHGWSLVNLATGQRGSMPKGLKDQIPVGWGASGQQLWTVAGRDGLVALMFDLPVQLALVEVDGGRVLAQRKVEGSRIPGSRGGFFQFSADGRAFAFWEDTPHRETTMLYRLSIVK